MSKLHSSHELPPLKPYIITFGALIAITLFNVTISQFTSGSLGLILTMVLASVNAILVLAVFMGLWWDNRFHTVAIVTTFLFLSLFFIFTMLDVATRDDLDPREGPAFDIKSPVQKEHSSGHGGESH